MRVVFVSMMCLFCCLICSSIELVGVCILIGCFVFNVFRFVIVMCILVVVDVFFVCVVDRLLVFEVDMVCICFIFCFDRVLLFRSVLFWVRFWWVCL